MLDFEYANVLVKHSSRSSLSFSLQVVSNTTSANTFAFSVDYNL